MKVFESSNFTRKEDIQVQVACAKLAIKLTANNDIPVNSLIRVRLVSPSFGTKMVIERTQVSTLLEISAQKEGFYRTSFAPDVTGPDPSVFVGSISGTIDIGVAGALNLSGDSYLSVDIDSPIELKSAVIHAIDAPVLTGSYYHYNPTTINGLTRDISLERVSSIALCPANIREVQIHFPNRAIEYTQAELQYLADDLNDLVSVAGNGSVVAGAAFWTVLDVPSASRMVVEPFSPSQFSVYLVQEKSI